MLISQLSIRGFKSYGNNEQILNLNTEKGELILLMGKNGAGKSISKNSEIEINVVLELFDLQDILIFLNIIEMENEYSSDVNFTKDNIFIITIEQLNILQEKISFIDKYDIKVNTQNGFKKIKAVGITSPNSVKIEIKTSNFELSGSPYHRVIKENNWIFLKDLVINDEILTKNGYEKLININHDDNEEDLWDIEVDGEEYYSNGIVSHNSSLLDSFDFVLFGKCKGKRKKYSTLSTLPNRINNELLNKIKFNSNGVDIEIERGISPNILKLTENGIVNDRAGKVNLDEKIEKYIGFDIETFKSFISMSINDFKNFISLSNEEKQILLDKLFNLEIINILNSILKDINKSNKNLAIRFDTEITTLQDSINSIQISIQKSLEKEKEDIEGEIENLKNEMNSKKEEFISLKEKVEKIKIKDSELKNEIDEERNQFNSIQNDLKNIQKEIDLYNLGKCPTCKTSFDSDEFMSLLDILNEKKIATSKIKEEIESNMISIREKHKKLQSIADTINKSFTDITYLLKNYKVQIDSLQSKMSLETKSSNSVKEFENTIADLNSKKEESGERMSICKEKEFYYKELSKIFGDEGVKKSIIAGIIKPINHFIEENVKKIGLPFQVKLNENFNAEIKQFGMDVDHDTLSVGETKKMNVAVMFAYIMLIRTKKNINILFLDEIFASVDMDGIESILSLLKDFASKFNVNIFVVHHAIMNKEYFDRIIEIRKNVFSEITEISNKN